MNTETLEGVQTCLATSFGSINNRPYIILAQGKVGAVAGTLCSDKICTNTTSTWIIASGEGDDMIHINVYPSKDDGLVDLTVACGDGNDTVYLPSLPEKDKVSVIALNDCERILEEPSKNVVWENGSFTNWAQTEESSWKWLADTEKISYQK
jgi:hypothetical protein